MLLTSQLSEVSTGKFSLNFFCLSLGSLFKHALNFLKVSLINFHLCLFFRAEQVCLSSSFSISSSLKRTSSSIIILNSFTRVSKVLSRSSSPQVGSITFLVASPPSLPLNSLVSLFSFLNSDSSFLFSYLRFLSKFSFPPKVFCFGYARALCPPLPLRPSWRSFFFYYCCSLQIYFLFVLIDKVILRCLTPAFISNV